MRVFHSHENSKTLRLNIKIENDIYLNTISFLDTISNACFCKFDYQKKCVLELRSSALSIEHRPTNRKSNHVELNPPRSLLGMGSDSLGLKSLESKFTLKNNRKWPEPVRVCGRRQNDIDLGMLLKGTASRSNRSKNRRGDTNWWAWHSRCLLVRHSCTCFKRHWLEI